jgi:colicin import membrane protein
MGPELATALTQMRARIMFLWKPPAGAQSPNALVVTVRIQLKPDGRVDGTPQVLTAGQGALFVATRDSAIKAVIGGQPYGMLPAAKYALWKDIEIVFDPRDLPR